MGNYFDNRANIRFPTGAFAGTRSFLAQPGPDVVGGNSWDAPEKTGFSDVTRDRDGDGFVNNNIHAAGRHRDRPTARGPLGRHALLRDGPDPRDLQPRLRRGPARALDRERRLRRLDEDLSGQQRLRAPTTPLLSPSQFAKRPRPRHPLQETRTREHTARRGAARPDASTLSRLRRPRICARRMRASSSSSACRPVERHGIPD